MKLNYQYSWGKNLVDFNSLCPNGKFYYQVTTPSDIYWGLFVAKISFLDIQNKLIHYDESVYANPLNGNGIKPICYATFSKDGNFAYYLERIDMLTLNHVLIDLKLGRLKRSKCTESSDATNRTLERNGFTDLDLGLFEKEDWTSTRIDNRQERNMFLQRIWKP